MKPPQQFEIEIPDEPFCLVSQSTKDGERVEREKQQQQQDRQQAEKQQMELV